MNVRLILERKGKRIWTAQLRGSQATLGRAVGCTIRIPSSEVSRKHCRLRVENDLLTVEDLESINGTFLNGVRVRDIDIVRPGDRLALGSLTFVVEYALTAEALQRLGGDEYSVLEADDEIEIVEKPANEAAAEPLEGEQEADAEMFILDDEDEMQLPEGGDLRDFLIELDDTDERSGRQQK